MGHILAVSVPSKEVHIVKLSGQICVFNQWFSLTYGSRFGLLQSFYIYI